MTFTSIFKRSKNNLLVAKLMITLLKKKTLMRLVVGAKRFRFGSAGTVSDCLCPNSGRKRFNGSLATMPFGFDYKDKQQSEGHEPESQIELD